MCSQFSESNPELHLEGLGEPCKEDDQIGSSIDVSMPDPPGTLIVGATPEGVGLRESMSVKGICRLSITLGPDIIECPLLQLTPIPAHTSLHNHSIFGRCHTWQLQARHPRVACRAEGTAAELINHEKAAPGCKVPLQTCGWGWGTASAVVGVFGVAPYNHCMGVASSEFAAYNTPEWLAGRLI